MEKLLTIMNRFGVAKLSELVGMETLESMERLFRVKVTSSRLSAILVQRYGAAILAEKKLRDMVLSHMDDFDRSYVLGSGTTVQWSIRSEAVQRLLQTLGLPKEFGPQDKKAVINPISLISVQTDLHPYQFNIKIRALQMLRESSSRVLLHMPTGAGKTRTACELMADILREEPPGPALIVWLAHSEELCQQAVESIERIWREKGDHMVAITRIWGGVERPKSVLERGFVVASFQSIHAQLKSASDLKLLDSISKHTRMIVVDEAHKAIAPTYDVAISTLSMASIPPRIMGLTATPGRGDDEDENRRLNQFFNGNKVGLCHDDGTAMEDGIGYLQDLGVLARLEREEIKTDLNLDLTDDERRKLTELMELPEGFLKRLGEQNERNLLIFNRLVELDSEDKQVIVFACSVAHAELLSDLCTARDIDSRLITGSTSSYDRAESIRQYKAGEVNFLINYGVLTTGFDAPNTNTVFITRPTASVVLYSQMIGRAIRGPKNGGNLSATVIDVIDNIVGMPSENMAYNYFNDVWEH